jgi:hypothetical protein
MTASIAAQRIVKHLQNCDYVLMKRPPLGGSAPLNPASGMASYEARGCEMTDFFDPKSYLDEEIARSERVLENARRASIVPAPDGYDSAEIVQLVDRHLEELKRVRRKS